jgi:hypothetical protein
MRFRFFVTHVAEAVNFDAWKVEPMSPDGHAAPNHIRSRDRR